MILTDTQKQELEAAVDLMAAKKNDLLTLKGTPYEAEAQVNLLWAIDGVNNVLKGFKKPKNPSAKSMVHFKSLCGVKRTKELLTEVLTGQYNWICENKNTQPEHVIEWAKEEMDKTYGELKWFIK